MKFGRNPGQAVSGSFGVLGVMQRYLKGQGT